ncbi:MAG TPA: hypothetical protein VMY76_13520 [Gemmatimonadales bacterium]|nr:hypothetical protein [Gemmatimonadales bacterium]
MARSILFLLLGLAGWPVPALAQLEVQGFLGSSVNAPSPLSITQRGQPDLSFNAHWATRPFLDTWYYAGRVGVWSGGRGWLFDFTHHKAYLRHGPPEVQKFRITNGLNLFTVSRGWRRGAFSYALGAGPVVTYPIIRVRGQALENGRGFLGGYFLSGGNLMASATRQFLIAAGVFLSLDGRISATYVRVPVAGGHASVPNLAMHLHVGLGFRTSRPATVTDPSP